jgi:acylphosphatase
MTGKARAHVVISGRVQGVAYRYFAEKYAKAFGVKGWARNLYDGRVEVLAEGSHDDIDRFLARLREGPRLALVEGFDITWEEFTGEFQDFSIKFFNG